MALNFGHSVHGLDFKFFKSCCQLPSYSYSFIHSFSSSFEQMIFLTAGFNMNGAICVHQSNSSKHCTSTIHQIELHMMVLTMFANIIVTLFKITKVCFTEKQISKFLLPTIMQSTIHSTNQWTSTCRAFRETCYYIWRAPYFCQYPS
jgi:hypothetical protein